MTFMNRSPKSIRWAIILFVLIAFAFSITSFAKNRRSSGGRHAGKASRRSTAREHRSGRNRRETAGRHGRRGGRQSARETRAERNRIAREQNASLRARERKLGRPLTRRERAAELRRTEGRYGRASAARRRRAEAARRAAIARAIARQRALDQAARNEAQSYIAKDDPRKDRSPRVALKCSG